MPFKNKNDEHQVRIILLIIILWMFIMILFFMNIEADTFLKDSEGYIYSPLLR